jgi:hypothetical protein
VEDIHFLPIFNSLAGLDQSKVLTVIKANDIRNIKVVENKRVIKDPTDRIRKKDGVTELTEEVTKAKFQHQNPEYLLE